jgi:hypothetical protein
MSSTCACVQEFQAFVALISDLAIVHDELPFMFSDNIVDLWVIVKPHK